MKPLSATLLIFAVLLTAVPGNALSPVYTTQKAKPNTASRIKTALLRLSPVHTSSGMNQFLIVDHWGQKGQASSGVATGEKLTGERPSENISSIQPNHLSTGAAVGIGVGAAAYIVIVCGLGERGFCRN